MFSYPIHLNYNLFPECLMNKLLNGLIILTFINLWLKSLFHILFLFLLLSFPIILLSSSIPSLFFYSSIIKHSLLIPNLLFITSFFNSLLLILYLFPIKFPLIFKHLSIIPLFIVHISISLFFLPFWFYLNRLHLFPIVFC